ncbi:MAG TPA: EAL domain-containing protein, partial [Deinococcales bacterium]|nr:EAL domain-containing protein [Deinococcales bacterium]
MRGQGAGPVPATPTAPGSGWPARGAWRGLPLHPAAWSLRVKALVASTVLAAGMLVCLGVLVQVRVAAGFDAQERAGAIESLRHLDTAVETLKLELGTLAADWSEWDDTYNFVLDGNPEYVAKNMTEGGLNTLNLNLMAFLNREGRVVQAHGTDPETGHLAPLPPQEVKWLSRLRASSAWPISAADEGHAGFADFNGTLMLVAIRPILTSQGTGPMHGAAVVGRVLGSEALSKLADLTGLELRVRPLKGTDPGWAGQPLREGSVASLRVVSDLQLEASLVLDGLDGRPALELRSNLPRTVHEAGANASRFLIWAVVAVIVTFSLLTLGTMEGLVLRRLARYARQLRGGPSSLAPLTVDSSDELGGLASAVNDGLRRAREQERHAAEQNEVLNLIAMGAPVGEVLAALAHDFEASHPGLTCVVHAELNGEVHHAGPPLNGLGDGDGPASTFHDSLSVLPTDPATAAAGFASAWTLPLFLAPGEFAPGMPVAAAGFVAALCRDARRPVEREALDLAAVARLATLTVERTRLAWQVAYRDHHDHLTGLLNRAGLHEALQARLAGHGEPVAVLALDLDRFKDLNDALGLQAGDAVLARVAERLREAAGATDALARLSADEFMLVTGAPTPEAVERRARALTAHLAEPMSLGARALRLDASVGVSLSPADGQDAAELQSAAIMALHAAKQSGPGGLAFYSRDLNAQAQARLALEARLKAALENGEFELHYQPVVDASAGQIQAAEALIRWRDPKGGLVMPGAFIPAAERSGLISGIGEWVLDEACRQLQAWRAAGLAPVPVAVNVSARQLEDPSFVPRIVARLQCFALPARWLRLEITEGLLLAADAGGQLRALRELGVGV